MCLNPCYLCPFSAFSSAPTLFPFLFFLFTPCILFSQDKLCLPHHILEEKGLLKVSIAIQALVDEASWCEQQRRRSFNWHAQQTHTWIDMLTGFHMTLVIFNCAKQWYMHTCRTCIGLLKDFLGSLVYSQADGGADKIKQCWTGWKWFLTMNGFGFSISLRGRV